MAPDKGVFKRKGSDVWQHRVFIPKDVQCHYGGKTEFPAKSLRTRDLKEANCLARQRQAKCEQEFDAKRALHDATAASAPESAPDVFHKPKPTSSSIEALAGQYRQLLIERDFKERAVALATAEADPEAFWSCKVLPRTQDTKYVKGRPYSVWDRLCERDDTDLKDGVIYALQAQRRYRLKRVKEELQLGQTVRTEQEAAALLKDYVSDEAERRTLSRRLMIVEAKLLEELVYSEEIDLPPPTAPLAGTNTTRAVAEPDDSPLLSIVSKAWIAEKTKLGLTPLRVESCERAVELFIDIAGDRPISSYKKIDVRDFKEVLTNLPPNRNKIRETRGMKARAAAMKASSLGLEPMSIKTANNKYIAPLRNAFDFAVSNYDEVDKNPFYKAAFAERSNPRTEWDPFTKEALTAFFNAPLYRGCKSATHWLAAGTDVPRDSVRFWLPLLLLYTGARVNEICKLRVKDISAEDGINFLSIEWEEDDDGDIAGRVKNATSHRCVPLHNDLLDFGFLEFVDRAQAAGHERLFHELRPDRHGKLNSTIGKRFSGTFLAKLGIKTAKTSLKSFRHNFVDAARNSRIPDEIIKALKGDAFSGTLARYLSAGEPPPPQTAVLQCCLAAG